MYSFLNKDRLTHVEKEIHKYDSSYTYESTVKLIRDIKGIEGLVIIKLNWALDEDLKQSIQEYFKNKI